MTDADQQFLEMAHQSLKVYAIENATLSKVGHMNYGRYGIIKFCVTQQNNPQKHLLSVHYAKSNYNILKSKTAFESHHLWLEALDRDTPIVVQKPIRNPSDDLLTPIEKNGQCQALCALLNWVEGEVVSEEDQVDDRASKFAKPMGALLAHLHLHASQWKRPETFERSKFDSETVSTSVDRLRHVVSEGKITNEDFAIIEQVEQKITHHLNALPQTNETWGLLHGDFHGANCVHIKNDLCPIDFDFCTFGYFLYDIAYTFKYLEPPTRHTFLEGYEKVRPLPQTYQQTAETLLIAQRLHRWSHLTKTSTYPTVPTIVAEEFQPFLNDQSLLFDLPPWEWND